MSWEILTNLLNMNTIWSAESLMLAKDRVVLPAHEYCQPAVDRSGNNVMMPQIEKVQEKYLTEIKKKKLALKDEMWKVELEIYSLEAQDEA